MVSKLHARRIRRRVFKVDDHELLVLVGRQKKRRLSTRLEPEKVPILRL